VYYFFQSGLRGGNLVRLAIRDGSVKLADGKLDLGELQLVGRTNRSRAFADTYSKVRILTTMLLVVAQLKKNLFCVLLYL
jgi:hypothetical protein